MTDHYGRQARQQLADVRAELAEARSWARHGYESGQRHCGWTDHGVAPAWLTEGWPTHTDTCQDLTELGAVPREIAYRIRAELVCCNVYQRVQDGEVSIGRMGGSHVVCYWGEASARLAEGRAGGANSQSATSSSQIGSCPDPVECQHQAALGQAEARIAAVRALHRPAECVNVRCKLKQWCIGCDPEGLDGCAEHPWPCPTIAALDGPAQQPAGPPQLIPASIAATEPVQAPTFAAMTAIAEQARVGFLVERLRLEAAIVTAVEAAGLVIVRSGPVEEVAAHPGTVNRLKAVVLGCFERVDASGAGPLPGPVTRMTGLPVTADHTLPPGEVHLRPHPRRCLSGWHSIPGEVCICQPHGIGEAHGCPEGCPTHNPGGPDVPDGAIGGPDTDEAADGPS